jgi:hypothetical protein
MPAVFILADLCFSFTDLDLFGRILFWGSAGTKS